jgi:hypothetical protein
MSLPRRCLLIVLCGLALTPVAARAQSAAAAALEGEVRDETGAVLPGAVIAVTHVDTGLVRTLTSGPDGRYRAAALPVGEYRLVVSLDGFASVDRSGLVLQVGELATADVTLRIARLEQTVTVTQDASIVETGRPSLGGVVSRTEIDHLPINGRNFLDFSTTVAGVTSQQVSGQGSGLSVNGQRGRSNNVSVDGVDNNGQLNGNTRLTMSQEAVREFQVVTTQFAPEFGRAAGGLVNIVSRSGTNRYSGNAFLFLRDETLDARNALAPPGEDKPPFRRRSLGGTAGGPLVRRQSFFFAALERIDRDESDIVTISDASVDTINRTLAARPVPGSSVTALANGTLPVSLETTLASLKVDHHVNPDNALVARYIYGRAREVNAGGVAVGGLTDVSGGGGLRQRDQSILAGWTRILGTTLVSETRLQFAPRVLVQFPNDPSGPRVSISGVATWGRSTNFPTRLDETRFEIKQDLSYARGRHLIKFGGDVSRVNADASFPVSFAGSFTFGSLADFVNGRPTNFTQGFGNPALDLPDTLVGLYWQDSFHVRPGLTLVYGLRYDYDAQPQGIERDLTNPVEAPLQTGINRDGNNVAPRVGVTYDPFGDGRTVVRAGYGVFYDKLFLLVARNALIARQSISLSGAAAAAQFAQGAFPESRRLPAGFSLTRPSINLTDPDLQLPYAHQWTLGIERQLREHWAAGLTLVVVRGESLLRSDNVNLGPPTVLTVDNAPPLGVSAPGPQQVGRPYYGPGNRLNPEFNNIQQVSSNGRSRYWGLQGSMRKRLSQGLEVRANYTLSDAKDDGSDFVQAEQPSDPYDREAEFSASAEHVRHRFTLTGVWTLPGPGGARSPWLRSLLSDWVLATAWRLRSGVPQNVTVGSDVNGDGNSATDRPIVEGRQLARNSFTGPDERVIDLRLSKRLATGGRTAVLVIAEAFNLLNRANYIGVNTTWGTQSTPRSTFGQFTSAGNPREIQVGIKFQF